MALLESYYTRRSHSTGRSAPRRTRSTGVARRPAAPPRRPTYSRSRYAGSSRRSSSSGRSYTRTYSSRRSYASQPSYRPRRSGTVSRQPQQVRSRPIVPIPSADAIADLFNEIAGFKREYGQLGQQYNLQRGELQAARALYLKQLADTFAQQRTSTLEDFASRGLADSGIANEAIARLQNVYAGQRGAYETEYTGNLNELLRNLQGSRSDILAKRAAAERRYNQLRAQRAAALRAAGYGQ